jgi:hypothetical protein
LFAVEALFALDGLFLVDLFSLLLVLLRGVFALLLLFLEADCYLMSVLEGYLLIRKDEVGFDPDALVL